MKKNITINDIARLTGVSKTTISHFLNNKFDGMSEATRDRIQKVIDELEYRPNRQARALKAQHSSIIGIAVTDISNSYTSRMLKGIMDRLNNTNYHTLIMDSDLNIKREQDNIEQLLDAKVDGIILQPFSRNAKDYDHIRNKVPIIQIDRYVEPMIWPAVVSDNFIQSKNLAQLFIERGYERVIIVSPPIDRASSRINRYEGLKVTLASKKIEIKEVITNEVKEVVVRDNYLWNEILDLVQDDKKTVIYAFNGGLLYGLVKFLQTNQISVPKQVGVVGYDDGGWADLMSPGITSVEQNPVLIGSTAANKLLDMIEGKEKQIELIRIVSKLNIRDSL